MAEAFLGQGLRGRLASRCNALGDKDNSRQRGAHIRCVAAGVLVHLLALELLPIV